jgi:archaellum biogenesis ATPase FlaH
MALNDALGEWAAAGEVTLCFDSLSILLQYADTERVFRFLHVLTNRLTELGASTHFHLDPAAHDERTIAQLAQAFDSRVSVDNEDDRVVRR